MQTDEENQRAKIGFITAFFDDLDRKIKFLLELENSGHREEALLLCSCYIDWLASGLCWPEGGSKCFVRMLKEFGGEHVLSQIHPKMLEEALIKLKQSRWAMAIQKILPVLQQAHERLYNDDEMIVLLTPVLNKVELAKLKTELWRGTLAAIAYSWIRVPAVHGFGAPDGVSFHNTTFQGQPVPPIEFPMLHNFLKRIATVARERSLSIGKYFGHDFK
jgi:hypothetical protein